MRLRRLALAASMSAGYASKRLRRLEESGHVMRVPEHYGQPAPWPWRYARTAKPLPEAEQERVVVDPWPAIDAMCRHA